MTRSGPTLHPQFLREASDVQSASASLAQLTAQRLRQAAGGIAAAADADIRIPIDSVSKDGSFDAYIHVGLVGGASDIRLMVDSGNATLILPDFEAITRIPDFEKLYKVEPETVPEPWGAQARIVTGPIVLPRRGGSYTIPSCRFYACTSLNSDGHPTANFGIGCVTPWSAGDERGLQSPLSCVPGYDFVEIDYAPVDQVLASGGKLRVAPGSSLVLCKTRPDAYATMLRILPDTRWMALRPLSLDIGGRRTPWPGNAKAASIAMIDTGGGPVFLSDPAGDLRKGNWPDAVPEPLEDYWKTSCLGLSDDLAFSLSDGHQSVSLSIDVKALTPAVQGLCLVMCEKCDFMRDKDGMNIGGLTALFYSILIDYKKAEVGFARKAIADV